MQNLITMGRIYSIKLENFEGPLDLLCHLIDKNKMDIYDINISEIADQYIDYINQMEKMNLDITSEFLIMASALIYLKSKSLLPKENDDEEELSEIIRDLPASWALLPMMNQSSRWPGVPEELRE